MSRLLLLDLVLSLVVLGGSWLSWRTNVQLVLEQARIATTREQMLDSTQRLLRGLEIWEMEKGKTIGGPDGPIDNERFYKTIQGIAGRLEARLDADVYRAVSSYRDLLYLVPNPGQGYYMFNVVTWLGMVFAIVFLFWIWSAVAHFKQKEVVLQIR